MNGNWGNTITAIELHLYTNCTMLFPTTCVHMHTLQHGDRQLQSLDQSTTDNYQLLTLNITSSVLSIHTPVLYIPMVGSAL